MVLGWWGVGGVWSWFGGDGVVGMVLSLPVLLSLSLCMLSLSHYWGRSLMSCGGMVFN